MEQDKKSFLLTAEECDKVLEKVMIKEKPEPVDNKSDEGDLIRDPMGFETVGYLTADQYWRLEAHQLYIDKASLSFKNKTLLQSLLQKDIQLMQMKLSGMQEIIAAHDRQIKQAKNDYQELKKKIEQEVGIDLKSVIIDDVTYAIRRDVPDKSTKEEAQREGSSPKPQT